MIFYYGDKKLFQASWQCCEQFVLSRAPTFWSCLRGKPMIFYYAQFEISRVRNSLLSNGILLDGHSPESFFWLSIAVAGRQAQPEDYCVSIEFNQLISRFLFVCMCLLYLFSLHSIWTVEVKLGSLQFTCKVLFNKVFQNNIQY